MPHPCDSLHDAIMEAHYVRDESGSLLEPSLECSPAPWLPLKQGWVEPFCFQREGLSAEVLCLSHRAGGRWGLEPRTLVPSLFYLSVTEPSPPSCACPESPPVSLMSASPHFISSFFFLSGSFLALKTAAVVNELASHWPLLSCLPWASLLQWGPYAGTFPPLPH